MQQLICLVPSYGEGSKGQISLNYSTKVNFKDFLYQTVCVCVCVCVFLQIKILNILNRIFVLIPGLGLGGTGSAKGIIYFEHCHVTYKINGNDKRNRIQVKVSS